DRTRTRRARHRARRHNGRARRAIVRPLSRPGARRSRASCVSSLRRGRAGAREPSIGVDSPDAGPRPVPARRALAAPRPPGAGGPCVCDVALFRSELVEIACWRCLRDTEELRGERSHAWPAFTFVHEGAYLLHTEGRTVLMDPGHVSFQV